MISLLNFSMWFWLGVLVASVIIEAITFTLTTVWTALASVPMIFLSKTHLPFKYQLIIFSILTIILILTTRPFAIKKFKMGSTVTNIDSLIGEDVLVLKAIKPMSKGEVRTSNGIIWQAESDQEIEEGTLCTIIEVKGNTLIIKNK